MVAEILLVVGLLSVGVSVLLGLVARSGDSPAQRRRVLSAELARVERSIEESQRRLEDRPRRSTADDDGRVPARS